MKTGYKQIKTVEDAAKAIGITLLSEETHRTLLGLQEGIIARNNYLHYLLTIVCKALNGDWEADWRSNDEIWQIWCYVPARLGNALRGAYCGLGILHSNHGPTYAHARNGVSLCLKTEEIAYYAKKQFEELWIEYLTGFKE
jgi:hypothetical protein